MLLVRRLVGTSGAPARGHLSRPAPAGAPGGQEQARMHIAHTPSPLHQSCRYCASRRQLVASTVYSVRVHESHYCRTSTPRRRRCASATSRSTSSAGCTTACSTASLRNSYVISSLVTLYWWCVLAFTVNICSDDCRTERSSTRASPTSRRSPTNTRPPFNRVHVTLFLFTCVNRLLLLDLRSLEHAL